MSTFDSLQEKIWECIRLRNVQESYADLQIVLTKLSNPATLGAALLAFDTFFHA